MKKILMVIFLLLASGFTAFGAPLWAQQDTQETGGEQAAKDERIVLGIITVLDQKNNQITIKRISTGEDMTIVVAPEEIAKLHEGDKVRVWLKGDTNEARHIRRIPRR